MREIRYACLRETCRGGLQARICPVQSRQRQNPPVATIQPSIPPQNHPIHARTPKKHPYQEICEHRCIGTKHISTSRQHIRTCVFCSPAAQPHLTFDVPSPHHPLPSREHSHRAPCLCNSALTVLRHLSQHLARFTLSLVPGSSLSRAHVGLVCRHPQGRRDQIHMIDDSQISRPISPPRI